MLLHLSGAGRQVEAVGMPRCLSNVGDEAGTDLLCVTDADAGGNGIRLHHGQAMTPGVRVALDPDGASDTS